MQGQNGILALQKGRGTCPAQGALLPPSAPTNSVSSQVLSNTSRRFKCPLFHEIVDFLCESQSSVAVILNGF